MKLDTLNRWLRHFSFVNLQALKLHVYNRGYTTTLHLTTQELAKALFENIPEDDILDEIDEILS